MRDRGLVLGAAPAQPLLEFAETRRQHENRDRIFRVGGAQLAGALDVDIQQDIAAAGHRPLERLARRAVARVEHSRPFGHLAGLEQAVKFVLVHEAIIDAVDFALARGAGSE